MRKLLPLALALLTLPALVPMHAQKNPGVKDPLLDHLIGTWIVTGTVADKPVTYDVTGQWVLGHQYVQLHEVSRDKQPTGEPQYEATITIGYNPRSSDYGIVWLDTYGGLSPLTLGSARRVGDQLPFVFLQDLKDKSNGLHTTMQYLPRTDSWFWSLDSEDHYQVTPFARLTLNRLK